MLVLSFPFSWKNARFLRFSTINGQLYRKNSQCLLRSQTKRILLSGFLTRSSHERCSTFPKNPFLSANDEKAMKFEKLHKHPECLMKRGASFGRSSASKSGVSIST